MPDLTLSAAMDSFLSQEDPANVFLPLAGGTMDDDAEIVFDSGSKIRETPDTVGIEEVCANDYIHRWQSGSLYITQQGPDYWIRSVQYGFTSPPSVYQDENSKFQVGSRYILDNGSAYVCTDASEGAAVWVLTNVNTALTSLAPSADYELQVPGGTPTLGEKAKFYITPSIECVLTMAAGIIIPSDSTFTSRTIPANTTCIVQIEYNGSFWMLTTVVGDYTAPV